MTARRRHQILSRTTVSVGNVVCSRGASMGEQGSPVAAAKIVTDVLAEAVEVLSLGRSPSQVLQLVAIRLGDAVCADAVCVGSLDLSRHDCDLRTRPTDIDTQSLVDAALGMPQAHPVLNYWLAGHTGVAMVSSVVDDRSAWRHSQAYDVLRRTVGCTETGGIRLDSGGPVLRMIGFAREGDFKAEELALLALARRPVIAVVEHAVWLDQRGTTSQGRSERDLVALDDSVDLPAQFRPCEGSYPSLGVVAGLGITSREYQVLVLLAEGLPAAGIGRRLSVSTRTVHRHLSHLYAKLGTHDRLSAVLRAQELGLLGRSTHGTKSVTAPS